MVEFCKVDFKFVGRFIAANMSLEEVERSRMSSIIPRRRYQF